LIDRTKKGSEITSRAFGSALRLYALFPIRNFSAEFAIHQKVTFLSSFFNTRLLTMIDGAMAVQASCNGLTDFSVCRQS
jgi:hypothetical protein